MQNHFSCTVGGAVLLKPDLLSHFSFRACRPMGMAAKGLQNVVLLLVVYFFHVLKCALKLIQLIKD